MNDVSNNDLFVCGLPDLERWTEESGATHVVSILPPDEQPPTPPSIERERHLRLEFHDIDAPAWGEIHPEPNHVVALVDFLRPIVGKEPILLHCMAGVSRSMAGAYVGLCLHAPGRENEAARHLRRHAPHAWPNGLVVRLADQVLGANGRMIAAIEKDPGGQNALLHEPCPTRIPLLPPR